MSNEAGQLLLRPLIEDAHEVIPRNQVDFSWPKNVELGHVNRSPSNHDALNDTLLFIFCI